MGCVLLGVLWRGGWVGRVTGRSRDFLVLAFNSARINSKEFRGTFSPRLCSIDHSFSEKVVSSASALQ